MKIFVENNKSSFIKSFQYVATFPVVEYPELNLGPYPVNVNPNDAEQMLFILNAICYHPQANRYIRSRIPFPFFPDNKVPNRYLPLVPLLQYLGRPSKINSISWSNDILFVKSPQGLLVKHCNRDFEFPGHVPFADSFIKSFGQIQYDRLEPTEPISDNLFTREANNNVPQILAPFETFFINAQHYVDLCVDLLNICFAIENIMDMSIIKLDDNSEITPFLSSIIDERSSLNN
jgi:hypothetical protein